MRTISTLCASGAGISIASVGLAVVREESATSRSQTHSSRNPSPSDLEMTAVAAYPPSNLTSSFANVTPRSAPTIIEAPDGKARASSAKVGQKRAFNFTPRTSFSAGMERAAEGQRTLEGTSQPATPEAQPHSWLRRLSSSLSTSRDSNHTPTSRPGSSALSHSNGSLGFSHSGSSTAMLPGPTSAPMPPNKLVKRASSLHSSNGSPLNSYGSGSKLPLPVFRRPATSHQRSATLQGMYADSDSHSDRMSLDGKAPRARDPQHVQFFTPRVRSDDFVFGRRRSSTGIPTPIKRVYPDRKYKPLLVRAHNGIRAAATEVDYSLNGDDEEGAESRLVMTPSYASSPLPQQISHLDQGPTPRRSFSISDLLSVGPQPLWKRPPITRGKTTGSKSVRRTRPRVVSAPHSDMGSAFSRADVDSERPAKRRDLTDPASAQRSIYSSASSNRFGFTPTQEVELNLGASTPQSVYAQGEQYRFAQAPSQARTPSPSDERRLPSASYYSATVRQVRVSGAQSEVPSTVGSESEYRSVGDASTDYQSDAIFDSYTTRTTRSSSGKRGPHIETIFDESPPDFSSGRSTRLKDLLNEGSLAKEDHFMRYRHSTIEEEESVMSTPVRSLQDKSLASTPSMRPGLQQPFTSSPPAVGLMPDPDEMNWDAEDDESAADGFTNGSHSSPSTVAYGVQRSLPFRLGPKSTSQQASLAGSTPLRANGAISDRANLFDWAEAQPSPGQNHSPPRPRTVHGKKDQEARGSRASGRRAPSGMHARSHSVPVVPDVDGKRNNPIANKFGTWGVGSKAVTEDWNEDFDFDEPPMPAPEQASSEEQRGHDMFVPKSIREQQENVMSNIKLLREWGLLIEELKELRMRAVALDMLHGRYANAWREVDAMIELADQETEEQTLEPRRSPPSSPAFDYSAFEESRPSISTTAEFDDPGRPSLSSTIDDFEVSTATGTEARVATPKQIIVTRPRKDSEAVARSVIEAIQSKRAVSESTVPGAQPEAKKVPFDTATLRHIVPYVKDLQRKVKDALRETEGLYSSPRRRGSRDRPTRDDTEQGEPDFRSIFDGPLDNDALAEMRLRREQAHTDHDGFDFDFDEQRTDLAKQMEDMRMPE